ncbi:MAG TPA: hypothetical protein DD381_09280 [Lentisphaeria bacterium]|nr:MAG: hypothetical protein A2X47_13525 [Lentisphaerae bacterium GWF2_38_69]HBM16515.1 hypothetical protein [Lentisphaeria bacterium]
MRYMKNVLCASVLFMGSIFMLSNAKAEELAKGEQPGIYVGKLEIQPSVIQSAATAGKAESLKRMAESLDTQFISALSATRVFQLLERKRKSDLEQEQGFAATAVDVNDKDAAQLGKMAGARYVLLPQIDGFEDMVDIQEYKDIHRFSMGRKLYMSVTVAIVDTTTGQYLPEAASMQMTKNEMVQDARNEKFIQGSNALNVELAKDLANALCQEVIKLIRPAKVIAITGKQILINRGNQADFKQGIAVEFFAYEDVKDEDSGEIFRNEVSVGKGTLIRSDAKQSYAKLEGQDLGVAKGCIVKIVAKDQKEYSVPVSAPGGSLPEAAGRVPAEPAPMTPGSSEKPLSFDSDNEVEVQSNESSDQSASQDKPAEPSNSQQ